jgi:NitT/TauT family transport system substrate-binding protein
MMKRIFQWVALISILTMGAWAEETPRTALKVGIIPVPEHAKLIIAREKGFFASEGLDVELVEFQNSADGITALRAGKIDVGSVGVTAPLVHISKGADNIRLIGGLGGNGSAIVANADFAARFKGLADLKGSKVGTVRLSSSDAVVRGALNKANIDWKKDLQIFELKNPAAVIEAVKSGEVDAGVVWAPFDIQAEDRGLKVVIRTDELSPGHPCCRLAITAQDLEKRDAVWVGFLKAIYKAERFLAQNRPETVELLTKSLKVDKRQVEETVYGGHTEFTTDPNATGIVQFWDTMRTSGFVESDQDIHKFIDGSVARKALDALAAAEPDDAFWKSLQKQFNERN